MTTISDVKSVLAGNPAVSQVDSVQNCGRVNSMLQLALEQELGLPTEIVQGPIQSQDPSRPGTDQHMWIQIPSSEIEDAPSDVIVDGALDQFTASNYDSYDGVEAVLNPNGSHIPSLVIATAGTSEYEYYPNRTASIN